MEHLTINNKILKYNVLKEVVFLESSGSFTRKYCSNGREFLIEGDLSHFEESLPDEKFFRINESYIINADYLKRIKVQDIKKNVLLNGGIELSIDQEKYWDLIKFLKIKYNVW
ncbi:MAG: LytTR family transcriptional regulator DNA-binding domain-containing protein [Bacteroidales bacterium]|jgi:DNA-binding LytR/AlgR family response regulator|nr:LytTR family transcriptional regulator DNA-binding domain-containing protein [Bacteroidales bacterium]